MQSSIIYANETTMPSFSSLLDQDPSPATLKKTIALLTQQLLQSETALHARNTEYERQRKEIADMKMSFRNIRVEVEKYSEEKMYIATTSHVVTVDPMERKRLLRESLLRRPTNDATSSVTGNIISEPPTKRTRQEGQLTTF